MAVNEILPFAYLVNANIITQTEYQSASWRPGGFVQGVAISPQLNKVWHQGSFVASALGQFIADNNIDVIDDGDVVGLAGKIANAIRAVGGGGGGITDANADGVLYGRLNNNWAPAVSLADLLNRLTAYLPLAGGIMNPGAQISLGADPTLPEHAVTQRYLENRLSGLTTGDGGGVPDAGPGGPYGRTSGAWVNLDGFFDSRYLLLTGGTLTGPGNLQINGNLNVHGPSTFYIRDANDPVTIYCDQGLHARLRFSHLNVDLWTAGLNYYGAFVIADEGRAATRMSIEPDGPINFWGKIGILNGATIIDGDLVVANSVVFHTAPSGGFEAYGNVYFNGPAVCRSYLVTIGADPSGWGLSVSNASIYCAYNYSGGGNISCSGQITANGGVNVPGGKLWVNQSMDAYASGGGQLVNYWKATSTFEIYGQFEAKSVSYFDGLATCWNALYAYVGLWVRTGSLTIENGDLQIHIGSAFKPNGGEWSAISSAAIKKEITDYSSGLDALCRLRPVSYRFNGLAGMPDDGQTYYGIIAEEALEAMPELKVGEVLRRTHPEDDKEIPYTAINSSPVIWALVNAVKELAAKVETLEARGG